jgi:hypothetical protein
MKIIIDELMPLIKKTATDWTPFFIRHNIEKDVFPLYEKYDKKTANIITAYIILAYFQDSRWLRNHKDRWENKVEIMSSLLHTKESIDEPFYSVLNNSNVVANLVIDWALQIQQDWRIPLIETYRNFQAHTRLMAVSLTEDIARCMNISKAMEEGKIKREEADVLQKQFDKDFELLNTALLQENRSKLSEIPTNQLTWEQHLIIKKENEEKPEE